MRRAALPLLLLSLIAAPGCPETMQRQYRDDPFLADMAADGDGEMLRNINSLYADNRRTALHLAAFRSGRARREGFVNDAARLENIIIHRYQAEKDPALRLYIVRVCAPLCGRGASAMVR